MHNLSVMSEQQLSEVKIILTDIDDTLTTDGRLTSAAYGALERLSNSGYKLIPVTGRCAGWWSEASISSLTSIKLIIPPSHK